MALIFHLSSESAPLPQVTSIVWDKLLHVVEYGVLAILFYRALSGEGLNGLTSALLALAATSLYGASDEWHQMFVPLRSSDVGDWVADTAGAALAVAAYAVLKKSS